MYVADPDLALRHWPAEETAIAYHPGSASTHLIDQRAWSLLQAAARGPRSFVDLRAGLDLADDAQTSEQLSALIEALLQVGLLRQLA